jgi:hypothetical protein
MMEACSFLGQATETLMAVTLKFAPGCTIRWGAKRFVVVDYADMTAIS